ncbi:hypothetical protein [Providencia rettgeri]|nr:hypothetical protein [Providencia rettgeri]
MFGLLADNNATHDEKNGYSARTISLIDNTVFSSHSFSAARSANAHTD